MRTSVAIAAAIMVPMMLASPAAAAQLPDDLGDVVEETTDTATEAVEDTTDSATEAVEDITDAATEAVEDTTESVTATPLVPTATPQVPTATPQVPTATPQASASPVPGTPGGTGGAAGDADDQGASGGFRQPEDRGSFQGFSGTLGSGSAATGSGARPVTPEGLTPGSIAPGRAPADSHGMLVATVRFDDGRAPFVSHVNFDQAGDTTFVGLSPTSGTPLAGPDGEGAATGEFRGLVAIAGEEPFRADVTVVVRDDGLVLLLAPLKPLSVTGVLSRMVERLSSTGLALLPLGSLALALFTVGALALIGSRNRRWEGLAAARRP